MGSHARNWYPTSKKLPPGYIIDWNADTPFGTVDEENPYGVLDYPSGATLAAGPGTSIVGNRSGPLVLSRVDWGDGSLAFFAGTGLHANGFTNSVDPTTASGNCNAFTQVVVAKMGSSGPTGSGYASGPTLVGSQNKGFFGYRDLNAPPFGMCRGGSTLIAPCPAAIAINTPFVLVMQVSSTSAAVNPGRARAYLRVAGQPDVVWTDNALISTRLAGFQFGYNNCSWQAPYKRALYYPTITTDAETAAILSSLASMYL